MIFPPQRFINELADLKGNDRLCCMCFYKSAWAKNNLLKTHGVVPPPRVSVNQTRIRTFGVTQHLTTIRQISAPPPDTEEKEVSGVAGGLKMQPWSAIKGNHASTCRALFSMY